MKSRNTKIIELQKRILILCEGETEVYYFEGLKHDDALKRKLTSINIDIYQPENYSPLGLVNEAIKRKAEAKREKNPYDAIWVVFDRNGHAKIPEAFDKAEANGILVAFSVICFEYWILLHFERTTRPEINCDDLISYLTRNHYPNYQKAVNHYKLLKNQAQTAIQNGQWLGQQVSNDLARGTKKDQLAAYTDVHGLVSFLLALAE